MMTRTRWDYNNAYPRSGPGTEPPNFIQVFKDFRRGNTYEMWKKYAEDAFSKCAQHMLRARCSTYSLRRQRV